MIKRIVGLIYEWKKLVIYSLSHDGHILKGETVVSVHIFKEYSDREEIGCFFSFLTAKRLLPKWYEEKK